MALYYDNPINDATDWGGDESTGGLKVKGSRVQQYIKQRFALLADKIASVTGLKIINADTSDAPTIDEDFLEQCCSTLGISDVADMLGAIYITSNGKVSQFRKNDEGGYYWKEVLSAGVGTGDVTHEEFDEMDERVAALEEIIANKSENILRVQNNMEGTEITVNLDSTEEMLKFTPVLFEQAGTVRTDLALPIQYTIAFDNGQESVTGETVGNIPTSVDIRRKLTNGKTTTVTVTCTCPTLSLTNATGMRFTVTSVNLTDAGVMWYKVIKSDDEQYNFGPFHITGQVSKDIHVRISNNGTYNKELTPVSIGNTVYTTNNYYYTIKQSDFPAAGTDVYTISIWITAGTVTTSTLSYNVMFVEADQVGSAQLVTVNSVADKATNGESALLYKFACYNGGSPTASPTISLSYIQNNIDIPIQTEVLEEVATEIALAYNTSLQIESDLDNIELTSNIKYGNQQAVRIPVDNSAAFTPTSNAVLYINPANRNNASADATRIVNAVMSKNSAQYYVNKESDNSWTRMAWVDGVDGWTVDDGGRKCLRLPARTRCVVPYKALSSIPSAGKVIEFTYKVCNAADYGEPMISVADNPTNDNFHGIRITPSNITVHTNQLDDKSNDSVQGYNMMDEQIVNVQVVYIPKYHTDYGNFIVIYVNGIKKCLFTYDSNDVPSVSNANIILGSQTADLYVYNVRVYNTAFGFLDALKNFYISLHTTAEREAARTADNEILDNDEVIYDKVVESGRYNYFVVEMSNGASLPSAANGWDKEDSADGNFEMHYAQHPEWDFIMTSARIAGQGTTSMNYWWWNLKICSDQNTATTGTTHLKTVITYPNNPTLGTGSTECYFDGKDNHPMVSRITAKKNYASSMQSHKMGTTAAFHDLHDAICGPNEANARVAIYQYPAIAFQRTYNEKGEAIYTCIGLYTIGPDKGDKKTFGYKHSAYKSSLLTMEGANHNLRLAMFNYPWTNSTKVGVYAKPNGDKFISVPTGSTFEYSWEIGNAGNATTLGSYTDTDSALSADGFLTYNAFAKKLFKPAYDVAYNNSTMILGVTDSLATINANPSVWRLQRNEADNGRLYSYYDIWINGEYRVYYYDINENKYKPNGINLLSDLGITNATTNTAGKTFSAMTINEKNELFREKRRQRFKSQMVQYWNLDDTLFCFMFCIIFGAKDNFGKNSYPYTFGGTGCKWRWRNDDLDTIFDIDNQSHQGASYSIEYKDYTDDARTAYVFKGEDSVFWTLVSEAFAEESKAMGRKILAKMVDLGGTAPNYIERLMAFFNKYYWGKAQKYFPRSAYNVDTEYCYEDAYPNTSWGGGSFSVDTNPLEQALGDHYEAEYYWVYRRMIYCMSWFHCGVFDSYNNQALNRITYRTQAPQDATLTPAIDLYTTVFNGETSYAISTSRVKVGNGYLHRSLGGTNTNVYIAAADYLSDIGDMCTLMVDANNNSGNLGIASKRLRKLKVGDVNAAKVTSNLTGITIGACPSLETIEARNLSGLNGTVNLTNCPRLYKAYFGATNLSGINIKEGSKIETLQVPASIQTLSLINTKFLTKGNTTTMTGLLYESLSNVSYLRLENCMFDATLDILESILSDESNHLSNIRIVGLKNDAVTAFQFESIAKLASVNADGSYKYHGITADGTRDNTILPVLSGEITLMGNYYQDDYDIITENFPNLKVSISETGKRYIKFADHYVQRKLIDEMYKRGLCDGIGITEEDALKITSDMNFF